ncbi:hypothetical protein AAMO2058_001564500 [Amorphochlora amoebiformis]
MDNPNVIFRTSRLPGNRRKTQTSKLLVPANRSAITQCFLFFSRKKFVLKLFENVENLQYQINGVDSAVHGLLKSTDMISASMFVFLERAYGPLPKLLERLVGSVLSLDSKVLPFYASFQDIRQEHKRFEKKTILEALANAQMEKKGFVN